MRVPAVFLFICLIGGCGKNDPDSNPMLPLPPTTEGYWIGTIPGDLKLELDIKQNVSSIEGNGTITILSNGFTKNATLSGTNSYPVVSIKLTIEGFLPVVVTGSFKSTTMISAELNESGFSHLPIILVKQQ